ncbi:MAG: hypothetical protein CMC13_13365 [Flavobacteriaceae bacterium]|nr:hypothetical protein [Flavobacteriaceae bacterium]|tara:strand:+ start:7288 stop:8433 length:1146 start_codon:yes stop_codon:yes gene_type:complete
MSNKILLIGLVNLKENKGDSNHFRKLINYLRKDQNVFTLTLGNSQNSNNEKLIYYPKNRIFRQLYWNFIISYYIIYLKITHDINVVYARPMGAIIMPYIICALINLKYSFEINGILFEGYLNKPKIHKVLNILYNWLLKKSEFIAASKGYCIYLNKTFNVSKKNLLELTLGYDKIDFLPSTKNSLSHLNLKNKNYIIFIGNIAEYQGLQYILKTIYKYQYQLINLNIELLIIGDGSFKKQLINYTNKKKITSLVRFIQPLKKSELKHYLVISKIGLSPFDYKRGIEGTISGLKTYDYFFHKVPILTSKMDDAALYIENKDIGKVIKKFDEDEIYLLIKDMLSVTYQNRVKENYEKYYIEIENNFSWDNRFKKIYKKLKYIS